MNDREFRQYLTNKRLEHQHQEAAVANVEVRSASPKKPAGTAKPTKIKKTRSA